MHIANLLVKTGCAALLLGTLAPMAQAQRNDILVVPARVRLVRLGFDMQAMRGISLLSYRKTDDPLQPLLHVWNRSRKEWQHVDVSQLARTPHLPVRPTRVHVIGTPDILPDVLLTALAHATEIHALPTLSIAEILTNLNETMEFSIDEWRQLARRYDLDLTEVPDERSRWGRFGPPRRYREQMEREAQQSATIGAPRSKPAARPDLYRQEPETDAKPATQPEYFPIK